MNGYIFIWKKIEEWEWYKDLPTFKLFIHLLINANYYDTNWRNIAVKRGQIISSIENLAVGCGITVKQTRRAIDNLKSTGEITTKGTNQFTIITICNYDRYQAIQEAIGQTKVQTKGQSKVQSKGTYINNIINKEDNKDCIIYTAAENFESAETENQNIDNSTKRKKEPKKKYGEYQNVRLTNDEATKLHEKFGDDAVQIVNYFDEQIEMKGYKYKSHYLAILNWGAKAYYQQLNKSNYGTNDYNNPASPDYVTTERIVAAGREWAKHFS